MFFLPKEVKYVLDKLSKAGFEGYIVGGCVRDFLLGGTPTDYDITTSATPKDVTEIFSNDKVIPTGIKHGTVTVVKDGMPLEITTFRIDADYADNRHPDSVIFTKDLKGDLERRDFTVNAMAYNDKTGLVDIFDGQKDLENRIIRCVGDAHKRFNEDALRIMRAIRFSSVLGFEIEKSTKDSIIKNKELLNNVSAERITVELKKLICGKNAASVIIEYHQVLEVILPEIKGMAGFDQKNPHHQYDLLKHTAVALENVSPDPVLRLAILFHDCGKTDTFRVDDNGVGHFYAHAEKSEQKAEGAMRRLKFDNATKDRVLQLVRYHDRPVEVTEKAVKRAMNLLSVQGFFDLLKIKRADTLALAEEFKGRTDDIDAALVLAERIIDEKACFSLKDLAVKGIDLILAGATPGKELGVALDDLLDAVICGRVENQKEKLLDFYKKFRR